MDILKLNFCFRRSQRARQISLQIHPDRGLEIVLPQGTSEASGLLFLKKNSAWVEKHLQLIADSTPKPVIEQYGLVKEIKLRCIDQYIAVRYLKTNHKRVQLRTPLPDVLIFMGTIKDARCCQEKLDAWLKQKGQEHLLPMLNALSRETGLTFNKASIRLQRSRWGSCSVKGDITLNARLLYFPYDVVRYVLIHELCHLKELNHSRRFWRLVESFEPRYRELRAELKNR